LTLTSYFHLLDKKLDAFPEHLYIQVFKKQQEEDLFHTSVSEVSRELS